MGGDIKGSMTEGSATGFERLNDLREKVGLSCIPATSADNITAIRLIDTECESRCQELGFRLVRKCGYSLFFVIARVLRPLLVAPESPKFNAKINDLARTIQSHLPFDAGYGGNVLWVLVRLRVKLGDLAPARAGEQQEADNVSERAAAVGGVPYRGALVIGERARLGASLASRSARVF